MEENEVKPNENTTTNVAEEKKLNICALLSFIFSLVGLLILPILFGIAAIALGVVGMVKFDPEKQKFKWMAIAGLSVGAFDVIFSIGSIIMSISALSSILY